MYTASFNGAEVLADVDNRSRKADKIRAVLSEARAFDKEAVKVLDVGCSHGIILGVLSEYVDYCIGIDYDEISRESLPQDNLVFVRADAELLPFPDGMFDVVICNHVYEHTDSPDVMINEIYRVLTHDGVCYFSGPNKYDLIEPHYSLPFLSWLPEFLSNLYVRLLGKGKEYDARPYSISQVRKMLHTFNVKDYTGKIIYNPERYGATDILPQGSVKLYIARFVYRFMPFIFPGFVFILRKR